MNGQLKAVCKFLIVSQLHIHNSDLTGSLIICIGRMWLLYNLCIYTGNQQCTLNLYNTTANGVEIYGATQTTVNRNTTLQASIYNYVRNRTILFQVIC